MFFYFTSSAPHRDLHSFPTRRSSDLDQVAGAEHFRTTVEKGLEIIRALRGWTSGLAVPHFVIDAPGGGGKIPLLPEYVESISDEAVVLKNYAGKRYVYRQPAAREGILVG